MVSGPLVSGSTLHARFNPSRELIWAKIANAEQVLRTLDAEQKVLDQCWSNLNCAKACIERRLGHTNLAWRFLHRVDEDILLALSDDELQARAVDVKETFELNVTEPSVRKDWLNSGSDGRLAEAIKKFESARGNGISNLPQRHLLREALHTANDVVDRDFSALSTNAGIVLYSGLLLAGMMLALALLWSYTRVPTIPELSAENAFNLLPIVIFGAMGAYVSNLLTKQDFISAPGVGSLRYVLHPLLTMPILGGFAAALVYVFVLAGLTAKPADGVGGYFYAILAIASGFAAEKVLRSSIGRVLRQLEQKAEKTVSTNAPPGKGAATAPPSA